MIRARSAKSFPSPSLKRQQRVVFPSVRKNERKELESIKALLSHNLLFPLSPFSPSLRAEHTFLLVTPLYYVEEEEEEEEEDRTSV